MFCAYTRPRHQLRVYRTIGPLVDCVVTNIGAQLIEDRDCDADYVFWG